MLGIYRFNWDCYRQGNVEGLFVADSKDVTDILGEDIYFGEILGKHSEVYGTIEEGEIELVTDRPDAVAMFQEFNLASGYNPFDYLSDQTFDEDEEEECAE